MITATRATYFIASWIKHNNLVPRFSKAKDVREFKKAVKEKLYGDKPLDSATIAGLKMVSWESLFKAIQS